MLQRLKLTDFRNYQQLDLTLPPGITLLLGDNGQGKTNLLEAVFFLAILRSFRTSRVRDLTAWGKGAFTIYGEVETADQRHRLGLEYSDGRRLRVDGNNVKRASDFIGRFFAVAFIPEDIELVKGAATERRRFLDITLTQLESTYLGSLQDYDHALKSRNRLLRENASAAAVRAFDQILIREGAALVRHRVALFAALEEVLQQAAEDLLPDHARLQVRYQPAAGGKSQTAADCEAEIREMLNHNWQRDQARGLTHNGPHRDDFVFLWNGKNLSSFGSEGQCRLAALTLKLAKARHLLQQKDPDTVVLLIDDVLGELDRRGRTAFLGSLQPARQVLLACTSALEVPDLAGHRALHIAAGQVRPG